MIGCKVCREQTRRSKEAAGVAVSAVSQFVTLFIGCMITLGWAAIPVFTPAVTLSDPSPGTASLLSVYTFSELLFH